MSKQDSVIASHACPTHIIALCNEASGNRGTTFEEVGRRLARTLRSVGPDQLTEEEWIEQLAGLHETITDGDDAEVMTWLDQRVPKIMGLFTARSRDKVVAGLCRAVIDEEVDITDP